MSNPKQEIATLAMKFVCAHERQACKLKKRTEAVTLKVLNAECISKNIEPATRKLLNAMYIVHINERPSEN